MEGIIGMIKLFAVESAPANWMLCQGQMLSKSEYPELFALIGNRFGGEGDQFALPSLEKDPAGFFVIRVAADPGENASYQGIVSQIVLWAGSVLPPGWMHCDGSSLSPDAYPLLAKYMGGRFGVDGQGLIMLPKLEPNAGVPFIICVEGLDPMGGSGEEDDDDY